MNYYAAIYLKNGCISLKPFNSNEDAIAYNDRAKKDSYWGPKIDKTKVVTRRVNLKWN